MALSAVVVRRQFRSGSTNFPDPGPGYSPDQVKEFYEVTHGFLTNFSVEGPTLVNGVEVYEFVKDAGTKG